MNNSFELLRRDQQSSHIGSFQYFDFSNEKHTRTRTYITLEAISLAKWWKFYVRIYRHLWADESEFDGFMSKKRDMAKLLCQSDT